MSGCRVFIGRLSPHARERDVEKFFKGYGRIREVNLKNGFGFVEFDDPRDADDAVYELNGKELCSERVTIEHARSRRGRGGGPGMGGGGGRFSPRFSSYRQGSGDRRGGGGGGSSRYGPPVRTEHRIIVENLSSRISWQDLKDLMRKVGEVTFVDAHRTNKNEGVVEFASHSDMKNALDKLDGTDLNGRKLKLSEDRKSRRSRSRSRGSRSYSRSRSRSRSPRSKSPSRSRSRNRSRSPRSASRTPEKKPSSGGGGRAAHRSTSRSPSRSKSRSPAPRSRTPPARSRSRSPPARSRSPPARSRTPPPRSRSPAPARKPSRSRSPSVESQH
ncbi:serine/arginine-rich splicing factor 5 [Salmo salar]|uniref:Serine/arginine-rich splicing factor 5 n=1 Tax=Salmo salar TaxID=8030 RepID=B5X2K4_SALSA|nr:serine/arginine-rich splicing factor 5 [Salmo salar]ACI33535.1 Splicing factor, arginine/serine-rich 5 [Salmo salar]